MAAADATIKIKPSVTPPAAPSMFAGVQALYIYGGTFNTAPSSCACATATRRCQCNPGKTSDPKK